MIREQMKGWSKAKSVAVGSAVILALLVCVMMLSKAAKPESAGGGEERAAGAAAAATDGQATAGGGEAEPQQAPAAAVAPEQPTEPAPAEGTASFLSEETESSTPELPSTSSVLVKVCLGLGVVIVFIFVARFLLRKMSGDSSKPDKDLLSVLSFTRLGDKQGIYAVKASGRVLLVGSSEDGLHTLAEMEAGDFETVEVDPSEFAGELAAASSGAGAREREKAGTGFEGWLESLRWKTARR